MVKFGVTGGTSTGLVNIVIVQPPSTNRIVSVQYGVPAAQNFTMSLSGTPAYSYILQYNTNLVGSPWISLSTNVADGSGNWTVVDVAATNATRFYRAVSP